MLFSLIPVLKHPRPQLVDSLSAAGRGFTSHGARPQRGLVTAQIALALVLSAVLMMRSFHALRSVSPGFIEPVRVQTFTIAIPESMVSEPERVMRLQHDVLDEIRSVDPMSTLRSEWLPPVQ